MEDNEVVDGLQPSEIPSLANDPVFNKGSANMITPSTMTEEEQFDANVDQEVARKKAGAKYKANQEKAPKEKPSFVYDVLKAPVVGVARGVEDVINTVGWLGNAINNVTLRPLFTDMSGRDASEFEYQRTTFLSDNFSPSESGAGKFIEEASRFAFGFIGVGGPVGGVARLGAGAMAKYLPNVVINSALRRPQAIAARVGSLMNGKVGQLGKVAGEGALRGAITDFTLTNEEDELFSDTFLNVTPAVRDTTLQYFASGEADTDDEDFSLLRQKLIASAEGLVLGAGFNLALDQFIMPMARAIKAKGLLGYAVKTPEEQAALKAAKESKQELKTDPIVGKIYQGERIVKANKPDGTSVYVKESQVAKDNKVPQGAEEINLNELKKLFPKEERYRIEEINDQVNFRVRMSQKLGRPAEFISDQIKQIEEAGGEAVMSSRGLRAVTRLKNMLELSEKDPRAMRQVVKDMYAHTADYQNYKSYLDETLTYEQLSELGQKMGFKDLGDVQKSFQNVSPEEIAIKFFKTDEAMKAHAQVLEDLIEMPDNPLLLSLAKDTGDIMAELLAEFEQAGSRAGRALNFYGQFQDNLFSAQYKAMQMARLKGVDLEGMLVKANAYQGLTDAQKRYVQYNKGQIANEMLYSVYVSNLLSGVPTHFINITSNIFSSLHKTMGRGGVALLSKDAASRAGAKTFVKKMVSYANFKDSFNQARLAFTSGPPPHLMSKTDAQKASDFRIFQEVANSMGAGDSFLHKTLGLADKITSTPGRLLNAGDTFFRNMTYNAAVSDNIVTKMMHEGISEKDAKELLNAIGTKDFDKVGKMIEFEDLMDRVVDEAKEVTFTMDSNTAMKAIERAVSFEVAGFQPLKFVIPFHRIGSNLVRYHIQNTPGLNRLSSTVKQIFNEGTQEAQERKMGEIFATSTMMTSAFMLAGEGIITGKGPSSQTERSQWIKAGGRPYAVKMPGLGYVELKKLGPVGVFLQAASQVGELLDNIYDDNEFDSVKGNAGTEFLVGNLAMLQDMFTPEFVSQGLPEFFGIFDGDETKAADAAKRYVAKFTVNMLPGTGYYTRNSRILEQMLTGSSTVKDLPYDENILFNEWKRAYPWLANMLGAEIRPQVDLFGNDRSRGVFSLNKDADLIEEYERLAESGYVDKDPEGLNKSMFLAPPSKMITKNILGEQANVYKLSNDEYYRYQKYAAGVYEGSDFSPPYGMSFKEKWREEMEAGYPTAKSMFGSASDEAVVTYVRFLHKQYKDQATAVIRSEQAVMSGTFRGIQEGTELRAKRLQNEEAGRRGTFIRQR